MNSVDDATPDPLCINTLRTLAHDQVQNANSGHPGLGAGRVAAVCANAQTHPRRRPYLARIGPRSGPIAGIAEKGTAMSHSANEAIAFEAIVRAVP